MVSRNKSLVNETEMIQEMTSKISQVLSYSQGIKEEYIQDTVKEMVNEWAYGKREFYKNFGNKLILEIPFSIEEEDIQKETDLLIEDFINNFGFNRVYRVFIIQQKKGLLINKIVTPCILYLNEDNGITYLKAMPSNEPHTLYDRFGDSLKNKDEKDIKYTSKVLLNVNMKLNKSFKYFYEGDSLKNVQESLSRLIQRSKDNSGTLCLSIHPLDYLSVSENNHNWKSCLNLRGDYRTGGLSYMQDNSTIVAYLKSNCANKKLPHFPEDIPWNSKKWRCLLYVSEDRNKILASKQYPYDRKSCLDALIPIIQEKEIIRYSRYTFGESGFYVAPWSNHFITEFDNGSMKINLNKRYLTNGSEASGPEELISLNSLIHTPFEERISTYNDIIKNSSANIYYTSARIKDWKYFSPTTVGFYIGTSMKCLCCGKTLLDPFQYTHKDSDIEELQSHNEMICESCEKSNIRTSDVGYCDLCDMPINYTFNEVIELNNLHICKGCLEERTVTCRYCGKEYFDDDRNIKWMENPSLPIWGFFCNNGKCFEKASSKKIIIKKERQK